MATDRCDHPSADLPTLPWAQTSFLEGIDAVAASLAARERDAALMAATRAVDARARHTALDHLYARLAEQAEQRGRQAIPKPGACTKNPKP